MVHYILEARIVHEPERLNRPYYAKAELRKEERELGFLPNGGLGIIKSICPGYPIEREVHLSGPGESKARSKILSAFPEIRGKRVELEFLTRDDSL
jgi:hypothetical protein